MIDFTFSLYHAGSSWIDDIKSSWLNLILGICLVLILLAFVGGLLIDLAQILGMQLLQDSAPCICKHYPCTYSLCFHQQRKLAVWRLAYLDKGLHNMDYRSGGRGVLLAGLKRSLFLSSEFSWLFVWDFIFDNLIQRLVGEINHSREIVCSFGVVVSNCFGPN